MFLMNKKIGYFVGIALAVISVLIAAYVVIWPSHSDDNEFNPFEQSAINRANANDNTSTNTTSDKKTGVLNFTVHGLLGECGAKMTFANVEGELFYNPNGKSTNASSLEHRNISLVSYDETSGKLILQVKKTGVLTGTLDGFLYNGVYEGSFLNVNGETSAFSMRE